MKLMCVCVCDRTMTKSFYEVVNKQISQNVIMNLKICECVIYTPRVLHFFQIHIRTHTDTHTKQIMVYLNFMVFLCLGLRFNYNAVYFNFGGWHSKYKPFFFSIFRKK